MGRFFSIDSGFYRFMTKLADFGLITIFTIVCSIPIITIGPALTALFYVALKLVRDEEGYIFRSYFKAFKDNFIQGFFAEIVVAVTGWFMYLFMEVVYRWTMAGGGWFLRIVYFLQLGVCVVLISGVVYLFPLISRFKNKLIFQVKNAILMAVRHIPQTIILLVVDTLLIICTVDYPALWIFDVGLIAFANSFVLASVFKLYMPKEESDTDEVDDEGSESDGMVDGLTGDAVSQDDTDNE